MKIKNNHISLFLISTILLFVVLGCGGSAAECVGTVEYQGKTFEGKAKTADEAKGNACNHYCREADPEYDAMYGIWVSSPNGIAAGSPSKQEAIYNDKALMKFVTETCSKRCVTTMGPKASCN
jgi:hypothetical protein